MKILVVEDDNSTAELVRSGLAAESNTVEVAPDGGNGSFLARSFDYDAIVLDYSLPKKDGFTVMKDLRNSGKNTPVIFLSVTDDPEIKVKALENGADDYMTKPFAISELKARLKAITRRPKVVENNVLEIDDVRLETDKHIVTRGKKMIRTTRKELGLLEYFMKNPGVVLSRAMLLEHVWTADSNPFSNTVEAHIVNLRKKLNEGNRPNLIVNVPGRGYVMDTPNNLKKFKF